MRRLFTWVRRLLTRRRVTDIPDCTSSILIIIETRYQQQIPTDIGIMAAVAIIKAVEMADIKLDDPRIQSGFSTNVRSGVLVKGTEIFNLVMESTFKD